MGEPPEDALWDVPPFITPAHLQAFGAIVYAYAGVENGIKLALARLMNVPMIDLLILAEPYTSASLGNVVRSIATQHFPTTRANLDLISFADDLQRASGLRNSVAHDRWVAGSAPGTIKPMRLNIRGKKLFVGADATEREWSLADLRTERRKLADLNERILAWLEREGYPE